MGAGRQSMWDKLEMDDKLILVEGWARDGLTNEQIAHNLGVALTTFYKWQSNKKEFANTLKRGKEVTDRMVENALFKSAIGYKYTEQAVTNKGNVVEIEKYEKPNTTAQIFWLKNRKPVEWRDKQEMKHDGEIGVKIVDDIKDES